MNSTGMSGPVNRSSRNRDLLVAYHVYGDADARERVIEENLPLVRSLAGRFAGRGEQVDDLVQVGSIGLIKAVDRFRVGQGDLATYAVPMIVGEIRRHLRDRAWPMRPPRGIPASNRPEMLPLEGDEPFASEACSAELERGEHRALLGAGSRVARRSRTARPRAAVLRRPQSGPHRGRDRHVAGPRFSAARSLADAFASGARCPLRAIVLGRESAYDVC